jgi:hypothetical protein
MIQPCIVKALGPVASRILDGLLQIGAVQPFWHASIGTFGRPGVQPVSSLPSSHVSACPAWTTPSPQNVQSGRHFTSPGRPGIGVGSGGSHVSPGSMRPFPHPAGRHAAGQPPPGSDVHDSCRQRKAPPAELHVSTVHGSSSKQLRASPVQWPTWQKSSVVHGLRSSHLMPSRFVKTQPKNGWQNSVVHALWSSQFRGPPLWQNPDEQ